jgi:hypothetical protein
MAVEEAGAISAFFQSMHILKDAATSVEDVDKYFAMKLADGAPDCPASTPFWSCNAEGHLTSLTFDGDPTRVVEFGRFSVQIRTLSLSNVTITMSNVVGNLEQLSNYNIKEITARNIVLKRTSEHPSSFSDRFPFFASRNVTLTNVDASQVVYGEAFSNFTASCSFTNVTLRCPIPRFLLRCFKDPNPPCVNGTISPVESPGLCPLDFQAICSRTCSSPPARGFLCDSSSRSDLLYLASPFGLSTIDTVYVGRFELSLVTLTGSGVTGIVTRVEVFDWRTRSWSVVFDDPQRTRRVSLSSEQFSFPPILTNRVRLTVEQWYQSHATTSFSIFPSFWPQPGNPFIPFLECEDATTQNARSMLDDTIADSLCIGRLCQSACDFAATSFTFQRTVKAQFLVIEGGNLWTGGQLATMTSDNTRVYKLDGRETSVVNVTGVGDVKRVRLVGDPVDVSLPAPTLPNRLGLPGVFVKTYRSTVPTGGVTLSVGDGGGLVAPNGTVVSVARVQNQSFAATDDGAIWQVNGTLWTALSGFTSLILNANEKAPARRLIAVGDRLVVVVAADIKVHDGSKDQLLVNRLVTQTPIDALDVQTGVWYNRLLEHGIAKNVSDVDVVRWNATAFAVVDRATREAAVFEWRPFPFALVKCTANTDCRACSTSEANEEPCRWCGTRCVLRQAMCAPGESSVCVDPTTTSTTATTTTTTATTTSTTTTKTTTPISITTSTTFSSLESPAESSDPLLPLYIVLGILGTLVLIAGVVIAVIKLRDLTSKPAPPNDVPMEEPKKPAATAAPAAVFDPDARYGELGDADPEDPRYGAL